MISDDYLKRASESIAAAEDIDALEDLRVEYLGRKSELSQALSNIGSLPQEKRKSAGKKLNEVKTEIESALKEKESLLLSQGGGEAVDLTRPGKTLWTGTYHPVVELLEKSVEHFLRQGYALASGPEIESEKYCFEMLNIPADHPARDMQDTFYLKSGLLPRTHTSSVQIRYMENNEPPIRIVAPGKVYRNEREDPTHLWSFHQLEGLVVAKGIHMGHLKGTLLSYIRYILGEEAEIRLRPNYFPYVEPALEIDVKAHHEDEWVELLGAGMVHPQVLRNVGIDPGEFTGFAFGVGIERISALMHGIDDIRYFWRPDLNFMEQFS